MSRLPHGSRARLLLGGAAVVVVAGVVAAALYVFAGNQPTSHPAGVATFSPSANAKVFTLDSSGSEATFTIDEVLFGQPNTVVGRTTSVSGQMLIDAHDPSQTQMGPIRVDLSTLTTDNDLRNRTLQNRILETGQASNQYAIFTAKTLMGLPATVLTGQTVSFQITGDLTLHGVTRSVTFDTQVTAVSATQVKGQAQATVRYADFGIAIPSVPSVTGVANDVKLALSFTAHA